MTDHALSTPLSVDREAEQILKSQRRRQIISATLRYGVLFSVGLVMLYPLIWLIGASFKPNSEIFANADFIPHKKTMADYING